LASTTTGSRRSSSLGRQSTVAPLRVGDHLDVEFESAQGWISGWNLAA
jgi:hypothetical protein